MARTVEDAALMLSVRAGRDSRSLIAESGSLFLRPLKRDFKGVRIGWSRDLGGLTGGRPRDGGARRATARLRVFGLRGGGRRAGLRRRGRGLKVLRAWRFELAFGGLLEGHRDQMKDTVIWNIEAGRWLGGSQGRTG